MKVLPRLTPETSADIAFLSAPAALDFRISVLFLARRREFDLFLMLRLGAEIVLLWPLAVAAKFEAAVRAGLDSVRVCPVLAEPRALDFRVAPFVMWLATAGSTEMIEVLLLRREGSRGMLET